MKNTKLNLICFIAFLISITSLDAKEYDIKDYLNPNNSARKAYIQKYKDIAMIEMVKHRIPASIKLAQGILESGDGKSKLASEARNHFGMKCGSVWQGDTYYLKDDDYDSNGNLVKSCFRVFETPEESYAAHSQFLRDSRKSYRYGFLFDLDIRDYRAWAKGLKKSGYATNPRYAQLLIGIIEANKLYEYDEVTRIDVDFDDLELMPLVAVQPSSVTTPKPPKENIGDGKVKNEVVLNNGLRMVFASEGDSPKEIAKFFGMKAKKLYKYNEFYESDKMPLEYGDRVYLQPKRKKWRGKEKTHKVKMGESMFSIAQMYGIRIKNLYKRNNMVPGTEPAPGQKINLRTKRKKKDIVKLTKKKNVQANIPNEENDEVILLDGENVADVVKYKVTAVDMNKRIDAYAKITEGTVTYTPPVTTTPQPPSQPVYTEPYPAPPQPPAHTGNAPVISDVPVVSQPQPTTPAPPVVVTQPAPTPAPSTPQVYYHTVQGGETLYAISKKYNISIGQLKIWNGLNSNLISIGQKLRVK